LISLSKAVPGVQRGQALRARWVGHQMHATVQIIVDEDVPVRASHQIAEAVREALQRIQPHLTRATIQTHPCGHGTSNLPATGADLTPVHAH
jgi:divalent metal cation (Fe/Co/Zn/Cd) transporter